MVAQMVAALSDPRLDLHDQSRRPVHAPQAYSQQAHTLVQRVRRALEKRQVGLVGARAIQQEIRQQQLLYPVPSLATIKRWLHIAGFTRLVVAQQPSGYYPAPAQAHRRVKRVCLSKRQVHNLPAILPITAGRVHFVRRVTADGTISFLGETWTVSKRLAQQYVWVTVTTHCRRLELYHRRSARAKWRRLKVYDYVLPETICHLRSKFKR